MIFPGRKSSQIVLFLVLSGCVLGCARSDYRIRADRDAYQLLKSRQTDWRWEIPGRTVEPVPESRMADFNSQDCPPRPPDDPAAAEYMRQPYHSGPVKYWEKRAQSDAIDSQHWLSSLPVDEDGKIRVTRDLSVDLALVHNREFQSQVESLYNAALGLSANRFEFDLNWFGGTGSSFTGGPGDSNRSASRNQSLGFSRNLAVGGQIATSLANSFVWNFGSNQSNFGTGGIVLSLTQPLLRGAFRHVRTESLTQSERSLLYSVREFARFRREFYLDIVQQYLGLLNQVQGLRIERENLKNLRSNLEEFELGLKQGRISPIQRDQVFQSYLSGRQSVFGAEQGLEAAFDSFRFALGLPSSVPMELDEEVLRPFELNSKEVEALQEAGKQLEISLAEYLPPVVAPAEFYGRTFERIEELLAELQKQQPVVEEELERWESNLEDSPETFATEDDKIDFEQQVNLAEKVRRSLEENREATQKLTQRLRLVIDDFKNEVVPPNEDADARQKREQEKWERVQSLVGQFLRAQISDLFVAQTQIRLFLIEIKTLEVERDEAVRIALENRLDLMNQRAQVTDAFRQVEIAANQLQSDLSVQASANLNTDGNVDNAFRLDGEANQYQLGVEFDGPLNRFSERNAFRAAQINYQQQRRQYMAAEDQVVNQLRQDLRSLEQSKFRFQLTRQSLLAAARQVEEAQINLSQGGGTDSSATQDLLQALQGLRNAQNGLISNWVSYEISRINLFVDLELLNLDERGVWINYEQDRITERTTGEAVRSTGESIGTNRGRDVIETGNDESN